MSTQDFRITTEQLRQLEQATLAISTIAALLAGYSSRASLPPAQGLGRTVAIHAKELMQLLQQVGGEA